MVKVQLDSVSFRGFLKEALYFYKVYYIKLKNVNAEHNRTGILLSECTSVHTINCELRLNSKGIFLYQTYAFNLLSTLVESNMLNLDNNVINDDVGVHFDPEEKSSIGILIYECYYGGNITGGYFEDQLVDILFLNSRSVNVSYSFFCNESFWETGDDYMKPNTIYMINSHENQIYYNTYLISNPGVPSHQKIKMHIPPNSHNNIVKVNNKNDLDEWSNANGWVFNQFITNGIIERSPRIICENANLEYFYGKLKQISGIMSGQTNDKPINPIIGSLFFNVEMSKFQK